MILFTIISFNCTGGIYVMGITPYGSYVTICRRCYHIKYAEMS